MVDDNSRKEDQLPPDALAKFLASLFIEKQPRVRAIYEVMRALLRRQDAAQIGVKFGAYVFPVRFSESEAPSYGHMFDAWCAHTFKHLSRAEARSQIEAVVDADIALNGKRAWNMLYKGAVSLERDNPDASYPCFEFVSSQNENSLTANSHGSSSWRPTSFVASLDGNARRLGLAEWTAPTESIPQSLVHLVACDGRYWEIFHERLLGSIEQAGAQTLTHVHVINPDRPAEVLQTEVSSRFPSIQVRITSEKLEIPAEWVSQWNGMNLRSFYTFLRFLRAPDVLRTYGKPVVITEFDAQISSRINDIPDLTTDMDVGLIFYGDELANYFPWSQVWAGTVLLNPNAGAHRYASLVADYCSDVFLNGVANNRPMWHVDQNALYLVYRFLADHQPAIKVARFPDQARPLSRNFGNAETH